MPKYLSMVKADIVTTDKPVVKPIVKQCKCLRQQMGQVGSKQLSVYKHNQRLDQPMNSARSITKHESFFFKDGLFQMVIIVVAFRNTVGNIRTARKATLDI